MKKMKAQITIEYLFLFSFFLVFLSISLVAMLNIYKTGESAKNITSFYYSSNLMYDKGEELCSMGNGNTFKIFLSVPINISYSDKLEIYYKDKSFKKETNCIYEDKQLDKGYHIMKNEDGTIIFD